MVLLNKCISFDLEMEYNISNQGPGQAVIPWCHGMGQWCCGTVVPCGRDAVMLWGGGTLWQGCSDAPGQWWTSCCLYLLSRAGCAHFSSTPCLVISHQWQKIDRGRSSGSHYKSERFRGSCGWARLPSYCWEWRRAPREENFYIDKRLFIL